DQWRGKRFALSRMRRFSPGSGIAAQMLRRLGAPPYRPQPPRELSRGLCVIYFHADLPPSEELEMSDAAPWPTELRLHKDRKALTIAFDNGETFDLSAEYLRVRSPSAELKGHSPPAPKT